MDRRKLFEWTRDLCAIVGALVGGLFVLVVCVVTCLILWPTPATPTPDPAAKPTLAEAGWILDRAGLADQRSSLRLLDSGRTPDGSDEGPPSVEAWCFGNAVAFVPDGRWFPPQSLGSVLEDGYSRALTTGHLRASCIPEPEEAARRFMQVQLLDVDFYQGRAESITFVLRELNRHEVYLVRVPVLPMPPYLARALL